LLDFLGDETCLCDVFNIVFPFPLDRIRYAADVILAMNVQMICDRIEFIDEGVAVLLIPVVLEYSAPDPLAVL
jgi:hypothetical protein